MEHNDLDLEHKLAEEHDKGFRTGFFLGLSIGLIELLIIGLTI